MKFKYLKLYLKHRLKLHSNICIEIPLKYGYKT